MADEKAGAKDSWPSVLTIDLLLDELFNAPGKTLTKEQVLARLGTYATHYREFVGALVHTGKINEIGGPKGGIRLRSNSVSQPEVLSQDELADLLRHLTELRDRQRITDTLDRGRVTETIRRKAIELLGEHPHGIRYSEWRRQIKVALPGANENTIGGVIWDLDAKEPEHVAKPAKGLFLHTKYRDNTTAVEPKPPVAHNAEVDEIKMQGRRVKESDFYKPFADWLVKELEECSKAIPVGGNVFKDKWGTPDVIGVREPKKSDIIKLPTEIVSAELKLDTMGLITAFGQACAYRLFSHKSYIVISNASQEEDIARLDALARIFGVGLILFSPEDPGDPDFSIRVRATKHDPDMFYVNRCMRIIEDELFG